MRPLDFAPPERLRERVLKFVQEDDNGCWIWQGYKVNWGYGSIGFTQGGVRYCTSAHRVSYEAFTGPIPEGLELDHLCRVRACVNPEHLEAITRKENILRGSGFAAVNAAKTHCPQGHPYTAANTRIHRKDGGRECRKCHCARVTRRKRERRAELKNAAIRV